MSVCPYAKCNKKYFIGEEYICTLTDGNCFKDPIINYEECEIYVEEEGIGFDGDIKDEIFDNEEENDNDEEI